jgi:bacillithiol biosynthesis cysteine-adding enzyme BshC
VEQEIACPGSNGNVILRAESIPFSEIPGQSKLFVQYQEDPLSLKKFYPSAVASHSEISERIPTVLTNYATSRGELCDALVEINRATNSGEKTFENISLLRDDDCVAVLTGQQAGLFAGPLYTIYKALSAIRAAECLRGRGFKAVPVFWVATEDHDFAEVAETFVLNARSELARFESTAPHSASEPVGDVVFDDSISRTSEALFDSLRTTEFTSELQEIVGKAYSSGEKFGTACGKFLAALTSDHGLIMVDPLHRGLKRLASPIYREAVLRSRAIVDALLDRNSELSAAGYVPQVNVGEDYFPLFWHSEDGQRLALRWTSNGRFLKAKGVGKEFTIVELVKIAEDEPWRLSPSVVLRPVVQDYLFPTVCYFGGGAEISYFAQNSEVYRCLERPVTPILHRQSFTVVDAKHRRTMDKYDLTFRDLFRGLEELLPNIVDEHIDQKTARTFAEVEEAINSQLNRLDRELSEVDTTLAANLATRRRKIIYHIAALQKKFRKFEINKDETVRRRVESLFVSLLPRDGLQERTLNVAYFLNQYGPRFVDWMYRSTDLDDRSHRVIYL